MSNSKKKNLFEDPFEDVKSNNEVPVRASKGQQASEFVERPWTDKATGASYMIKEKVPTGPQGDFRVASEQAEQRYRQIMGLPATAAFHERPVDDPFADERIQPEPAVNLADIESKIRERANFDTQREQSLRPTSEQATWASQDDDFVDHGDYITDPAGRIREKRYNTVGHFGTEENRGSFVPAKTTREPVVSVPTKPSTTGIIKDTKSEETLDSLQERLSKKQNIQVALSKAFRGLFGVSVANNIGPKPSISDRKLGSETVWTSSSVMDAGLMKPWVPPKTKTDRPQKPEQIEYAVGSRVMATVLSQKLVPGLQDFHKQDKDDLTIALGRTILNAMTVMPNQKSQELPVGSDIQREELITTIMNSFTPEILKGLVPPELLQDRKPRNDVVANRVTNAGSSVKQVGAPQRHFASEGGPSETKAPEVTRPTIGSFTEFGFETARRTKLKKQLFEDSETVDEAPIRERGPETTQRMAFEMQQPGNAAGFSGMSRGPTHMKVRHDYWSTRDSESNLFEQR